MAYFGLLVLLLGVALWTVPHLLKAAAPERRAALAAQYGENAVKGGVAVLLVVAILMMSRGYAWSAGLGFLWFPPAWTVHLNNLLMLVSLILLGAGHMKSNIRRFVRHPMLTAALIWALAHLLVRGEPRAVILFGGLAVWSVLSMVFINRRDGAFVPPPESPRKKDAMALVAGTVVFVGVAAAHWYVFGVWPFPG
ncbi:MAG: hypothetical protein EA355_09790 [Rhodobacteraceae bacterium]|nr:MAG: hypothetical protein EA355_09790 [Paracoccaceae bacterium]